jgi:hypothetical protein
MTWRVVDVISDVGLTLHVTIAAKVVIWISAFKKHALFDTSKLIFNLKASKGCTVGLLYHHLYGIASQIIKHSAYCTCV